MFINPSIYFHTVDSKDNIIFNGVNGAIDIVDAKIATSLKTKEVKKILELDANIISSLYSRGYLFKSEIQYTEMKLLVEDNVFESNNNKVINIAIILSYMCNMKCDYCFEKGNQVPGSITKEHLPYIKQFLQNNLENNDIILELYGGEPLLLSNMEIIKEILEITRELKIKDIAIITNGYNLEKYSQVFNDYSDLNITIQVTIDGTEEIHNNRRKINGGSFNEINTGILKCLENDNTHIVIRTNIDKENIDTINQLYLYFEEMYGYYSNLECYLIPVKGINQDLLISETELIKKINSLPEIPNFNKHAGIHLLNYPYSLVTKAETSKFGPKVYYCESARGSYFALSPDGLIYPCSEIVGIASKSIGTYKPNIRLDQNKQSKWLLNNIKDDDFCRNCSIRFICGGGCAKEKEEIGNKNYCEKMHYDLSTYFDYFKERLKYE